MASAEPKTTKTAKRTTAKKADQAEAEAKPKKPKKGSKTAKDPCATVELADSAERMMASATVAQIRKVHGDAIFRRASDLGTARTARIPTSIFRLDYALGGGFPVGRVSVVWGKKSSSKTTTLLKAIANAQRMCATCWQFLPCSCKKPREPMIVFMDVEGTFDGAWAQRLGVDLEKLFYSRPEYQEQTLDMAEVFLRKGVDVLVIDSIAFLAPAKEITGSTMDDNPGIQARQLGKGIRKFVVALNTVSNARGVGPTLLFTNQVRMKVGVMFGSPEVQPGGLATGFAASTETKLRSAGYEMDDVLGRPMSGKFAFTVEKNKTHYPRIAGEFEIALMDTERYRVGDAINAPEILKMGEQVGLVTGAGSSWKILDQKFGSKKAMLAALETDLELGARVRDSVMHLLLQDGTP